MGTLLGDSDVTNAVIEDRPLNKDEVARRRQKITQQVASCFGIKDRQLTKLANDMFFAKQRPKLLFILLNVHIGNDTIRDRLIFMREYITLFLFFDKELTEDDKSLLFQQMVETEEKYQDKLLERQRAVQRGFVRSREEALLKLFPNLLQLLPLLQEAKRRKVTWTQVSVALKKAYGNLDEERQFQLLAEIFVLKRIKLRQLYADIDLEKISRPFVEAFNESHIRRPIDGSLSHGPATFDEALVQVYAAKLFAHLPEPRTEIAKEIAFEVDEWFRQLTKESKEFHDKLEKLDYGEYYGQVILGAARTYIDRLPRSFYVPRGHGWEQAIGGLKVSKDLLQVLNNEILLGNTYFYKAIQAGAPYRRALMIAGAVLYAAPLIIVFAVSVGTAVVGVVELAIGLVGAAEATVTIAITEYGFTLGALSYISMCLQTFYLQHAVIINELGLDTVEFIFNLPAGASGRPAFGSLETGTEVGVTVRNVKGEESVINLKVVESDAGHLEATATIPSGKSGPPVGDRGIVQRERAAAQMPDNERVAAVTVHDKRAAATDSNGLPPKAIDEDSRGILQEVEPSKPTELKKGDLAEPRKEGPEKKPAEPVTPDKAPTVLKPRLNPRIDRKLLDKGYSEKALNKLDELGFDVSKNSKFTKQLKSVRVSVLNFANDFHDNPGFKDVLNSWKSGGKNQEGARFVMEYANDLKVRVGSVDAITFESPEGFIKQAFYEEKGARKVDITVREAEATKAETGSFLELKNWTLETLQRSKGKLKFQLIRDSALLGPGNIRWVFNSKKLARTEAVRYIERAILDDPYLIKMWGSDAATIHENVERAIQTFP
ncbi:MAG TPA: hypothetical protein VFW07_07285 [Parafilimonas sp.]|nr:hypothetical protein [Parafilimonas sp.]